MKAGHKKDLVSICVALIATSLSSAVSANPNTRLFWGDTHVHTALSPDAYMNGNRTLYPDDAYRYAKGYPVVNAYTDHQIQISVPLDFLVVADHAEYLGLVPKLFANDPELALTESGSRIMDMVAQGRGYEAYRNIIVATIVEGSPLEELVAPEVRSSVWKTYYETADRHYEPGTFTTFIGWEWTSMEDGANLHRVVFQREGGAVAGKYLPFSTFDGQRPEDLWNWLEITEKATGATYLPIPHNGNMSKGRMFAAVDSYGEPLSAEYAQQRMRWEPIYEVTQIKGDGETASPLSPDDEFADFETFTTAMGTRFGDPQKLQPDEGSYARSALMNGLEFEAIMGVNPFKFGLIGASDSHSGVSAIEEDKFGGKMPPDSAPKNKDKQALLPGNTGNDYSAAGLAAVWAEENTRESIFDAMRRREVYSTTGPRIRLRFFGGWKFTESDELSTDIAEVGYGKGWPMGSTLQPSESDVGQAPTFLIFAEKDPNGANLDRIQVVKGWLDQDGKAREKVFNVAASDGRKIIDNTLDAVGNTVDIESARYSNSIGDPALHTVWTDPDFEPSKEAFYYVRILQIPTPRQSLYAAVAMKKPPPQGLPTSIQERAYSSPIWYKPSENSRTNKQ